MLAKQQDGSKVASTKNSSPMPSGSVRFIGLIFSVFLGAKNECRANRKTFLGMTLMQAAFLDQPKFFESEKAFYGNTITLRCFQDIIDAYVRHKPSLLKKAF